MNSAKEIKKDGNTIKVLKFKLASKNIEINCLYGYSFYSFKQYLHDFDEPDITISISQEDIDEEKQNHPELLKPDIYVESDNIALTYDYGFLEPYVALRKIADAVIQFNILLIHGAVVAKDGYAYAFIAPSGVGKSTRVKLWIDMFPDSFIVNGDKPLIKITEREALACGTPWCGKEGWNTNTMVPLRAIFLLERSGEGTTIEEISMGKAFPFLLKGTHQPQDIELMRRTMSILKQFEGKTRIYKLCCPPTPDAIRYVYETVKPI